MRFLLTCYQSLVPGGRLVVVDREPKPGSSRHSATAEHEISVEQVEGELRQAKFEILNRQDHFIEHDSDRRELVADRRTQTLSILDVPPGERYELTHRFRLDRGHSDAALLRMEPRSRWYTLAFAGACALGSLYGFLQGAWPFGLVEAVWSMVAVRRWWLYKEPLH